MPFSFWISGTISPPYKAIKIFYEKPFPCRAVCRIFAMKNGSTGEDFYKLHIDCQHYIFYGALASRGMASAENLCFQCV